MRKDLASHRGISLSLALGLSLISLVLVAPCNLHAASNEQMITFSGQKLLSIFDGLGPSRFARYSVPMRRGPRKMSWLLDEKALDGQLGARYILAQCGQCNPVACFGSFDRATPCSGCCTDPIGCPALSNYTTDSKNYDQDDQVKDEPCGADCCDDFTNCPD